VPDIPSAASVFYLLGWEASTLYVCPFFVASPSPPPPRQINALYPVTKSSLTQRHI